MVSTCPQKSAAFHNPANLMRALFGGGDLNLNIVITLVDGILMFR